MSAGHTAEPLAATPAPGHAEDRAVQPSLGANIPTRVLEGAAGGAGHVGDLDVLHCDQAVALGEVGGGLVQPVVAAAGLTGSQLGDLLVRAALPLRHRRARLVGASVAGCSAAGGLQLELPKPALLALAEQRWHV